MLPSSSTEKPVIPPNAAEVLAAGILAEPDLFVRMRLVGLVEAAAAHLQVSNISIGLGLAGPAVGHGDLARAALQELVAEFSRIASGNPCSHTLSPGGDS